MWIEKVCWPIISQPTFFRLWSQAQKACFHFLCPALRWNHDPSWMPVTPVQCKMFFSSGRLCVQRNLLMLRIIIFLEDVKTTSRSFLEPVDLNKQTFSLMKKKKRLPRVKTLRRDVYMWLKLHHRQKSGFSEDSFNLDSNIHFQPFFDTF